MPVRPLHSAGRAGLFERQDGMKTRLAAALSILLAASPAWADDDEESSSDEGSSDSTAAELDAVREKKKAVVAGKGEESPLGELNDVRHGIYLETGLGIFGGLRGTSPTTGANRAISNSQPYVAITLGYDFPQFPFSVFATLAHGSSAQTNYKLSGGVTSLENFSVIPIEAGFRVGAEIVGRFRLNLTGVAGLSTFNPELDPSGDKTYSGPHAGGGVGFEYVTGYDAVTFGVEALVRYHVSSGLMTLSAYPRIKYVF